MKARDEPGSSDSGAKLEDAVKSAVVLTRAFVFGGRGRVVAHGLQIPPVSIYLFDSLNIEIWKNRECDLIFSEERLRSPTSVDRGGKGTLCPLQLLLFHQLIRRF